MDPRKTRTVRTALLVVAAMMLASRDAFAYVDPGSGSFLAQILFVFASVMVGMLAAGKQRIRYFISRLAGLIRRPFIRTRDGGRKDPDNS